MKYAVLFAIALAAFGQTSEPTFEVATIKPAQFPTPAMAAAGKMHVGINIDNARIDIGLYSLADLIRYAYDVKPYQVSGPDWMKTERFDVVAKIPEGVSKDKVPQMMQALLADRFKLKLHREQQEHPIYALVVAKGGPKLKEAAPDDPTPPSDKPAGMTFGTEKGPATVTREGSGMVVSSAAGKMRMSMGADGKMRMEAMKMSLPSFAEMLSRFVDRPVIDMTELKGNYQMAIELSMDDLRAMARSAGVNIPAGPAAPNAASGPADAASDPSGSSIFIAVQQLGLKLEPRKSPMDTLIVDHVEKTPTEN